MSRKGYQGFDLNVKLMIRKLKSGEYRIYSRKIDPKTKKRKNLGTFDSMEGRRNTSGPSSTSSTVDCCR
jgi:hypothetical protein